MLCRLMRWMTLVVIGCLVTPAIAQQPGDVQRNRFENHKLIRVHLQTKRELDTMLALGAQPLNCVIGVGQQEFSVSPAALAQLKTTGIKFEVLNENIGPLIQADVNRMQAQAEGGVAGGNWFADFKTWPQVNAYIDTLVALRPDLASKFTAGSTIENRTIYGIRITSPVGPAPPNKPAVSFSGCQHAREWAAVMVPMYIADTLVRQYDTDPAIHSIVDRVEFFIIPIMNPDGYEYTYAVNGNRLWRKNRRDNGEGAFGVDLNRNWSVFWAGGNSNSTDPNNELYIGAGAFSEPETATVSAFISSKPQIRAHIDFHSYSQLILQNWAHTNAAAPDFDLIDAVGTDMNQALFNINLRPYNNGWGGSLLYLASGVFPDWCYGARGILGYTIELRDTGSYGFLMPPSEIMPTCAEALPAALRLAEWTTKRAAFFFPRGLPATVTSNSPTTVDVKIQPINGADFMPASAKLFYRAGSSGAFAQQLGSPSASPNAYTITLPAVPCGHVIQYFFQVQTTGGAIVTSPADAPAHLNQTIAVDPVVTYDFESEAGWTTQNVNAFTGLWERGVPVNDPNWPYDPSTDADGSGQCYLTQNQTGYTGVWFGAVRLISPNIDLASIAAAGRPIISYSYFLHTTSPGNGDSLYTEISSNGTNGPWTEIIRHTTSGGPHWRSNAITRQQLQSLGVTLTNTMRLRFTAVDGIPQQTIIEAGIDAVRIANDCFGPPPPCIADIAPPGGGNGTVNVDDLLAVINAWGPCPNPPTPCPADIAPSGGGNGIVNVDDLLAVINAWGACP